MAPKAPGFTATGIGVKGSYTGFTVTLQWRLRENWDMAEGYISVKLDGAELYRITSFPAYTWTQRWWPGLTFSCTSTVGLGLHTWTVEAVDTVGNLAIVERKVLFTAWGYSTI